MAVSGIRLGMIADDLTGACDAGVAFAARGFDTVVRLSRPDSAAAEVTVVPTNSRGDPEDAARRKVERACRELIGSGIEIVYKKIDSTLYGNVAVEIQAALRACGRGSAWVAPAFPEMGRTVAGGWLHVAGSGRSVHLPALLAGCPGAVIRDAVSRQDLARIACAAMETAPGPLLVGSGGLAAELAALLAARYGKRSEAAAERAARTSASVIFFVGSTNPVTTAQVSYLLANRRALVGLDAAREALSRGRPLILEVPKGAPPSAGTLTALFEEHPPRGLALTGGDTALLVCAWFQARAIRLRREIRIGIPCGTLVGGLLDGLPVATKAGGFGGQDALAAIADSL